MKNGNIKIRPINICIFTIIIMLVWHYGITSYYGNFFQIEETGEIIKGSNALIDMISRILSVLSYISCIYLFLNYFGRKYVLNKLEFTYFLIFLDMLFVLFFITNSWITVLLDLGSWNSRMGIITVIACSLFFYAADEKYWEYIKKIICILVFVMSIFVFALMLTHPEMYLKRLL